MRWWWAPAFYAALQALERMGLHAIGAHPPARRHRPPASTGARHRAPRPQSACWLMTARTTGQPDARNQRDLVALLARYELPLIEDDVYAEAVLWRQAPAARRFNLRKGWCCIAALFHPGPRLPLGLGRAGRFYQSGCPRFKNLTSTTLGASVPVQQALVDYLRRGGYDKHLRRLRQTLATRKARMI